MGVTLLTVMDIIVILLCTLAKEVISQTSDIFPAKILVPQKIVTENTDFSVTCSTFGFKKQPEVVYVYLCKDGLGIQSLTQREDVSDTTFTLSQVAIQDSGNYSCVYSKNEYSPSEVTKRGDNVISILVVANFLPGDISVSGAPAVSEGDDVEFRCTVSRTLQTACGSKLIHSYLRKNETTLQVQAFNVTRREATFTIRGAVLRDSGHYSCVILPSKCIYGQEEKLNGNNVVFIEVKEGVLRGLVYYIVISLMVILLLCLTLWINKQAYGAFCNLCGLCRLENSAMSEDEQQQTGGAEEDLETHDDGSFDSGEEEEGYQNSEFCDLYAKHSRKDESEDPYHTIDDTLYNGQAEDNSAAEPSASHLYARSKRKTPPSPPQNDQQCTESCLAEIDNILEKFPTIY